MRTFLFVMIVFAVSASVAFAQESDPYSLQTIRAIVEERSMGLYSGTADKFVHWSGDRVALALLKAFSDDELTKRSSAVMVLIKQAFERPDEIRIAADRKPRLVLMLLDLLYDRSQDPALKQQIKAIKAELAQQLNPQ